MRGPLTIAHLGIAGYTGPIQHAGSAMRAIVLALSLFVAVPAAASAQEAQPDLSGAAIKRLAEDIAREEAAEREQRAQQAERTAKAWEHWARCIIGNLDKARTDAAVGALRVACRTLSGLR